MNMENEHFYASHSEETDDEKQTIRRNTHIGMSIILLLVIVLFDFINEDSVIKALFIYAGFTYGPLLGMYAFGFFVKRSVLDKYIPVIAILSPLFTALIKYYASGFMGGYQLGFELLIVNGLITFLGMLLFSKKSNVKRAVFV